MKKKISLILSMILVLCILVSCEETTKDKEVEYTEQLQTQANATVGFPNITNFFEKSQLKALYELRDDPKLVCYWYTTNTMTGKLIYRGTCIGYGIPYGASVTSPEAYEYHNSGSVTLPLAEPNGIYTNGITSSATWVLTTDEKGNIKPTYVEDCITVSQVKVEKNLCEEWSIPSDY